MFDLLCVYHVAADGLCALGIHPVQCVFTDYYPVPMLKTHAVLLIVDVQSVTLHV